jgi:hypothetical protein
MVDLGARVATIQDMRMVLAVVVTLACGCGTTQSDSDDFVHGVPVVEVAAPPQAEPATAAIIGAYERILGLDMSGIEVRIRWTDSLPDELLGATRHGDFGCSTWILSGSMFSYPKVLPHEIGHCVRWLLTGDGDGEHTDESWWGRGGYVDQARVVELAAGY